MVRPRHRQPINNHNNNNNVVSFTNYKYILLQYIDWLPSIKVKTTYCMCNSHLNFFFYHYMFDYKYTHNFVTIKSRTNTRITFN